VIKPQLMHGREDVMKLSVSDVSLVPSFVGGTFYTPSTIIIAYFYICNNNFHIAKLNFFDACCGHQIAEVHQDQKLN